MVPHDEEVILPIDWESGSERVSRSTCVEAAR